jgi:hypothetical protein
VSIRQLLLDRAANLVRLHPRRHDGRRPARVGLAIGRFPHGGIPRAPAT